MKTNAGMCTWIVAGTLALGSATCSAQNTCPWLNLATASGALGGSATMEVDNVGGGAGVCSFRLQDGTHVGVLRLTVIKADKPENAGKEMASYRSKCTSAVLPLEGIGNEAVLCASNAGQIRSKLVVGRVRDSIFTVSMSSKSEGDSATTRDALDEKAEAIARQLAGALF